MERMDTERNGVPQRETRGEVLATFCEISGKLGDCNLVELDGQGSGRSKEGSIGSTFERYFSTGIGARTNLHE